MAALTVLIIIGCIVVLALALPAVVAFASGSGSRKELREARHERDQAERRANMAVKGLRAIANGAGNPILEASDTLDRIESTYPKELN